MRLQSLRAGPGRPIAHNAELTQRQGQAYSQRSESPRFREESLHLGMRAAVDHVL
jgi:hypothetical protein